MIRIEKTEISKEDLRKVIQKLNHPSPDHKRQIEELDSIKVTREGNRNVAKTV